MCAGALLLRVEQGPRGRFQASHASQLELFLLAPMEIDQSESVAEEQGEGIGAAGGWGDQDVLGSGFK